MNQNVVVSGNDDNGGSGDESDDAYSDANSCVSDQIDDEDVDVDLPVSFIKHKGQAFNARSRCASCGDVSLS